MMRGSLWSAVRVCRCRLLSGFPHRVYDFVAMHGYIAGRVDSQTHLVTADLHDRNYNSVADDDLLIPFSRED